MAKIWQFDFQILTDCNYFCYHTDKWFRTPLFLIFLCSPQPPPALWPPGSALQRFKKFLKRDRNTRLGSSPKPPFKEDEEWKIPPGTWYRCNTTSHPAKRLPFACFFPGPWPTMKRQEKVDFPCLCFQDRSISLIPSQMKNLWYLLGLAA